MPSAKQTWGAARESLAESHLTRLGYTIVARNWRGGGGEVDRIAWEGEVLVFVEVRARSTDVFGSPAETVNVHKQQRLVRAAQAYLTRFPPGQLPMTRFDVVSIVDRGAGGLDISVIPGAFDAGR